MKYVWMLACGMLLSACGDEAITFQPKEVQKGFFRQTPCETEMADFPHIDTCLCQADMQSYTVSNPLVQQKMQEIETKNLCAGQPVDAPAEGVLYNIVKGKGQITRNDARYFAVVYDMAGLNAGAAHGRSWIEPVIYDRKAKVLVEQKDVVPEAARAKVNALILQQLLVKNKSQYENMLEVDKNILTPFITAEGCEMCVMYPIENGWEIAFKEYSIGAYAIGVVKLQLSDEDMGR